MLPVGLMRQDGPDKMSACRISAVVCTYNRYDCLAAALDSLIEQTLPATDFEILVIDNSADRSAADAYWAARRLPDHARVVFSVPPGLSRARNTAIEQAKGGLIAFLDDDAVADPDWLARYVAYFDANPQVGVAGGPVAPIWPAGAQTGWLPPSFIGCLTVVDLGDADRPMGGAEYAYGANMALRVTALGSALRFDTALGRIGGTTLLSNEEIVLQDRLVEAGWQKGYCSGASVRHQVDARRLSRNWFRSRMAWQAVSEAMSLGEGQRLPYQPAALRRYAQHLGVQGFIQQLFADQPPEVFDLQLHLVRNLVGYLLGAKDLPDAQPTLTATSDATRVTMLDRAPPEGARGADTQSRYVACAPSTGKPHLFTEARPGHAYLFDAYALSGNAGFLPFAANPWEEPAKRALEALRRSMDARTRSLTFLTLDPLLYRAQAGFFQHFLDRVNVPVSGFVHRLPETQTDLASARDLAARLHSLLVLSVDFGDRIREHLQVANVQFVPHHPSKFAFAAEGVSDMREELGIEGHRFVVGLLGELRRGKGLELLLDALPQIPVSARERFVFVVSGKCADYDVQDVQARLQASGCEYRLLAGRKSDANNYLHLDSRRYTRLLRSCDLGLLLYHGAQRDCVSGLLPDYVWFERPVLATAASLTGLEVRRHGLGPCLTEETPEALAAALLRLVDAPLAAVDVAARERYRQMIDPHAVADRLDAILSGGRAD